MSFTAPEDAFLDVNDAHLRVYGNVHADGLKLGQLEIVTTTSTGSTIQFLHQHTAFTTTSNIEVGTTNHDLFVDTKNSRVGVLTNTPTEALDVTGTVKATAFDGNGALLTGIPSSAINGTLSQWTTVTGPKIHYSDGNVGIGIADPLHTLDVVGDINFTGTLREDGNPFVSTPWTIESGPTALSYTLGNVGVGGTTPSAKLEVTGNAHVSTDLSVGGNLTINTISAAATHGLGAVTALSNTSADTVLLTNTGTSLVASGSIDVSGVVGTSGTGALTLPSGTTEQQPSTGLAGGMIRYNTTTNRLEVYNGTAWQSVGGVSATGGTATTSDGYEIHTFTSSGTLTVMSGGEVEYLVVAGGGGGGASWEGGGGGAGGMMTGSLSIPSGTHNIIVGTGGLGGRGSGISSARVPTNGNNSSFNGLVASGGGVGGQHTPAAYPTSGGSGGGGTHTRVTPGNAIDSNFGNAGGLATENIVVGAGGGGAGAAGQASTNSKGGDGGVGSPSSISGTSTYYAGGGGGGRRSGSPHGAGGNGGGGNGGSNGEDGSSNTGGGGGGGAGNTAKIGGDGGSGIVIIRYLT